MHLIWIRSIILIITSPCLIDIETDMRIPRVTCAELDRLFEINKGVHVVNTNCRVFKVFIIRSSLGQSGGTSSDHFPTKIKQKSFSRSVCL